MKALLRPAFVLGLSIAIAATSLIGSSSVALGVGGPSITFRALENGPVVYEGDRPTLLLTFTDPDPTDRHVVTIDWGDFTSDTYPLVVGARGVAPDYIRLQKVDPYTNDAPDALLIIVTVSEDRAGGAANGKTLSVTVMNAAPSFTSFALSATEIEAGGAVTAAGTFTDNGSADAHTLKLDWNDGSPVTTVNLAVGARSFTTDPPHTYTANGDYTLSAIVTDDAGAWTPATATLSVRVPNQAPTMDFEVTAGPEGGTSTLAVTFADADVADTHTVSVDWGDGGEKTNSPVLASDVTTFDAAHVYADTGTKSVVVTLNDSATPMHTVTLTKSVSPTNVGPALGSLSLSPSSVVDHQELTLSGSFTDPGTLDTFTLFVDWGDGNTTEQPLNTERRFSPTHSYAVARDFTITAIVQDRDGARSDPSSVSLVVGSSNHAPTGLAFDVTATGANVVVTGSFTDLDATDTHTVTLNWGDDLTQDLAADETGFTKSHVYAVSRRYTVTAIVTDHPAGVSTAPLSKEVNVTVPATSASDVIDEMSWLVRTLELDRSTERWLLKKLDDLRSSLAYGNGQVCSSSGTLEHLMAFAQRTLSSEEYASLSALTPRLHAAAGCATSAGVQQSPKATRAAAVTMTATPALTAPATSQEKDTTAKDATKAAKSDSKPAAGRGSRH